jgi:hypothetical protein
MTHTSALGGSCALTKLTFYSTSVLLQRLRHRSAKHILRSGQQCAIPLLHYLLSFHLSPQQGSGSPLDDLHYMLHIFRLMPRSSFRAGLADVSCYEVVAWPWYWSKECDSPNILSRVRSGKCPWCSCHDVAGTTQNTNTCHKCLAS